MIEKASVAIIGAGISGLSCARELRNAGTSVRVFEKSGRPGGRCATRLWQAHLVDYGAQYFSAQTPEFKRELLTRLFHFRPVIAPVINRAGKPIASTTGPRFYALQGNNYLGHVLAKGIDIHYKTPVHSIEFKSNRIECMGETYTAVVSCAPGPQTAKIFHLPKSLTLYEPCLTALFEYAGDRVGTSMQFYGHHLTTGTSPIRWSACENHKAGRIIGEKTVFVVHANPVFSQEHLETPPEIYLPKLQQENEALWQIVEGTCTAQFSHRWRYSRNLGFSAQHHLPPGLFLCGDNRTESDVEAVWQDGRKVAAEVLNYLAST